MVALTESLSLTASAHSIGDTFRQEVLVDGRHHLVTDEPGELGGTDTGPAPHELLPSALAACVAVTIRMYARTKGWALGELSVDIVYNNKSTPRHFDVTINLPDGLSPEQVRRLMRAAGRARCGARSRPAWSSTSTCRTSARPPERRATSRLSACVCTCGELL